MTHVSQYERTSFTPSDIGYGPCVVMDAEGRIIRTIATDVIRARDAANEKAAEAALRRLEEGPQPRRGKAMTFGAGRKKKVSAE